MIDLSCNSRDGGACTIVLSKVRYTTEMGGKEQKEAGEAEFERMTCIRG